MRAWWMAALCSVSVTLGCKDDPKGTHDSGSDWSRIDLSRYRDKAPEGTVNPRPDSRGPDRTSTPGWVVSVGSTWPERALSVTRDPTGNIFVGGVAWGAFSFGSSFQLTPKGDFDLFLLKLSGSAAREWGAMAGGWGADSSDALAADGSGNVLVAGAFKDPKATFDTTDVTSKGSWDAYLARYAPAGTLDWVVSFGGAGEDWVYGLAVDGTGNSYLAGWFEQQITFGSTTLTAKGMRDVFVAKVSGSGAVEWAVSVGGADNDMAQGLARDSSGNLYLTGRFAGQASFGTTTLTSQGASDIFVAKLQSGGQLVWAKSFGGTGDDAGADIVCDPSGDPLLTGSYRGQVAFGSTTLTASGQSDVLVAKLAAADGAVAWARSAGGADVDRGNGIAVDATGNVTVTGDFKSTATFDKVTLTSKGSSDIFVARWSKSGDLVSAVSGGGSGEDSGQAITTGPGGSVVVAGYFSDSVQLGGASCISAGSTDILIWSLTP